MKHYRMSYPSDSVDYPMESYRNPMEQPMESGGITKEIVLNIL